MAPSRLVQASGETLGKVLLINGVWYWFPLGNDAGKMLRKGITTESICRDLAKELKVDYVSLSKPYLG